MNKSILALVVYASLITGSVAGYTFKTYMIWRTAPVPIAVAADGLYLSEGYHTK